ncbi:MAG TPA: hypothetical protein VIG72_00925 [Pontibacter sp.]
MKKLLFIFLGTVVFACGNNNNTTGEGNTNTDATREDNMIAPEVQEGAGEEINPQLELDADSAENFQVDTVSSAAEIKERQ